LEAAWPIQSRIAHNGAPAVASWAERGAAGSWEATYAAWSVASAKNARRDAGVSTARSRHASVKITLDRYGHLMLGNEAAAAELLGAYLCRSASGAKALG
jgi:hypothetical protein